MSVESFDFVDDNLLKYIEIGQLGGASYFDDEVRKVNFVLVLSMAGVYNESDRIEIVIRNLQELGLKFEQEIGIAYPVLFIKIHMTDEIAENSLSFYDISQDFLKGFDYRDRNPERCSSFKTPLHERNVFQNVTLSSMSLSKLKIIQKMLSKIKYGPELEMRGILALQKYGIINDFYGLHDGGIQLEYWHNDDLLNERSLLAKYWANYSSWYKEQPLDLIHKYFGAEIAFYFAWFDFYNKMIAPIAVAGLLLSAGSIMYVSMRWPEPIAKVCNSSVLMCGVCKEGMGCHQRVLKSYCFLNVILYILEIGVLIAFALCVSIWGIFLLKFWSRREYVLKVRWNLRDDYTNEEQIRLAYKLKSKRVVNGRKVTYVFSKKEKYVRYIVGSLCYFSILALIVSFLYGRQLFTVFMELEFRRRGIQYTVILQYFSIVFQALFTMVVSRHLKKIVTIIANIIFPRTEAGYDKLLLYITFTLDAFNNYFPLFHIAFIKNTQSNIPNNSGSSLLKYASCEPVSCLLSLYMQLMVLMNCKTFFEKIFFIFFPKIKATILSWTREHLTKSEMPQYEDEYGLQSTSTNTVNFFFASKAVQYGMILGFIYGFPLAPLCALIDNILTLRLEAINLVYKSRRPVLLKKVNGIGEWNNILLSLTLITSLCNICIVIYVGHFVDRTVYFKASTVQEYTFASYSEFRPFDVFGKNPDYPDLPNYCMYRGSYYPPDHADKYKRTTDHFERIFQKFLGVYIFEKIIILIYVLLEIFIPRIPLSAKKKIYLDRTNIDNKYNQMFNKVEELDFEDHDETTERRKSVKEYDEFSINIETYM